MPHPLLRVYNTGASEEEMRRLVAEMIGQPAQQPLPDAVPDVLPPAPLPEPESPGLLGQLLGALERPRVGFQRLIGLPEGGGQQVARNLGLGDNILGTILGLGIDVATDPLTYTGLLGGGLVGMGARGLARSSAKRAAAESSARALAAEKSAAAMKAAKAALAEKVRQSESAMLRALEAPRRAGIQLPSHANVTYSPEVLAQIPNPLAGPMRTRVLSRITPEAERRLFEMGLGARTARGFEIPHSPLTESGAPSFVKARGGVWHMADEPRVLPRMALDPADPMFVPPPGPGVPVSPLQSLATGQPVDIHDPLFEFLIRRSSGRLPPGLTGGI